ncbi:MAG: FadR/GntR family transcriptional regulator [Hyphomicrobiales bacterium]
MTQTPQPKLGSADIASILRREISKGVLASKDRLPAERILADKYGVARGTVREALHQLAEDGLVEIRAGSGTYITPNITEVINPIIESATPLELIDTRFALEPHICRLAVLHARQSDFEAAETLLDQMEESVGDPQKFSNLDAAFHALLVKSTRNQLLQWIVSQINSVRNREQWLHMRQVILNRATITQYNVQHREILDALRARDPESAAMAMKDHLEAARLSLTRAVET